MLMGKRYFTVIKLYLYFFKSTVVITSVCQLAGIFLLFFAMERNEDVSQAINQPLFFIPFGFLLDMLYKEITQSETYYFYYNQGIRKAALWLVSFCGWSVLMVIIYFIFELCVSAWKWIV